MGDLVSVDRNFDSSKEPLLVVGYVTAVDGANEDGIGGVNATFDVKLHYMQRDVGKMTDGR